MNTMPERPVRRPIKRWIILMIPVLLITIILAARAGLSRVRPDRLEVQIIPLSTADYSQWETAEFNRVNPLLGTLLARQNESDDLPIELAFLPTDPPPAPGEDEPPTSIPAEFARTPTVIAAAGTGTPTATVTPTATNTTTATVTTTVTNTPTVTATPTNTVTATRTFTSTATRTATLTPSRTPTGTHTPSNTPTSTTTNTRTPTHTTQPTSVAQIPTSTAIIAASSTSTATQTPTLTHTPTITLIPTNTSPPINTPIPPTLTPQVIIVPTLPETPTNTPLPPVAAFTYAVLTTSPPYIVNFTNQSTGTITAYNWDLGDGNTSTVVNPSHAYAAPGSYTVTLTAIGPTASTTVSQVVQLAAPPDVSIGINAAPAMPTLNEIVVYTIQVTNNSASTATGVIVSHTLHTDLIYVADDSGGLYNPAGGIWAVGTLNSGETRTLRIDMRVSTGMTNFGTPLVTTASVTLTEPDPDTANNNASTQINVIQTDLAISKTVSNPAPNAGDTITYTLTLTNNGFSGATNIRVQDILPASLNFVSADPSPAYDVNTGIWTVPDLTNSTSASLTITASIPLNTAPTVISNTASIVSLDQYDPVISNNASTADIFVQATDVSIEYSVDNTAPAQGASITYTIIVRNNGASPAQNVSLASTLPAAGVTYVSSNVPGGTSYTPGGAWNIGTMDAGAVRTLTIVVSVNPVIGGNTTVSHTAAVTTTTADFAPGNNSATASFTIPTADLRISKSVDNAVPAVGTAVTYTLTVENQGPDVALGVSANDVLPAGVTFANTNGNYDPGTGIWGIGTLASGASASLNITAVVNSSSAPGNVVTNTAAVQGASYDPDTGDNTASIDITIPVDLAVSISVNEAAPIIGGTVRYTLSVQNITPFNASGVSVLAPLPAGVSYISDSGPYDPGSGIWTVGSLAPGSASTVTIDVTVTPGSAPNNIVTTTAMLTAHEPDHVPGNNTASANFAIQVDYQVTKTVNNAFPNVGSGIIYTITVTNNSAYNLTNVTVTDTLPAEVDLVGHSPSQGTVVDNVWQVGNLGAAGIATNQIAMTVNAVAVPNVDYFNTAAVTADQTDFDPLNNTDSAAFRLAQADLDVGLIPNNLYPDPGETVTFTLTLVNNGPQDATGIMVGAWNVGTLAAGNSVSLPNGSSFMVDGGAVAGPLAPFNVFVTSMNEVDPVPANNSESVTLVVPLDMSITKTVDLPNAAPGTPVTYTITLTNNFANSDATNVILTDILPAGVTYTGDNSPLGEYDEITGIWNAGTVSPLGFVELEIYATVNAVPSGTLIDNIAQVSADQFDADPANNQANAVITVP